MAGFDLTKIGELIKNVETQILKNGGDTNSDGNINTDTEKSIFNQVLEDSVDERIEFIIEESEKESIEKKTKNRESR